MARRLIAVLALTLVAAACGDDAGGSTTRAATTTAATTLPTGGTPATTPGTTAGTVPVSTSSIPSGGLGGGFGGQDRGGPATTLPPDAPGADLDFVEVSDDSGQITVRVPSGWVETRGTPWAPDGATAIGPGLTVAPSVQAWQDGWATPGVFIGATATFGDSVDGILDGYSFSQSCVYDARYDYDDGLYTGKFDWWDGCGDAGSTFVVIVSRPADGAFTIVVQMVLVTEADRAAADEIVNSYQVTGADA